MRSHIFHVNAALCFSVVMRQIRSKQRSLPSVTLQMFFTAVLFTLDWTTATLYSRDCLRVTEWHLTTAISYEFVGSTSNWCPEEWSRDVFTMRPPTWLPREWRTNYAHPFSGVYRVMHYGTLLNTWYWRLRRSEEWPADTFTPEVPVTRLSFGDKRFCCRRNMRLEHVRSAQTMNTLRKLIKMYLCQTCTRVATGVVRRLCSICLRMSPSWICRFTLHYITS